MKIRVCSDLHTDINKTTEFAFINKLDDVDLNIIAGDIAGDYQNEIAFLSQLNNEKPIVCVGGNHLGYNYTMRPERYANPIDGTKLYSINKLRRTFERTNIHYLENEDILVNGKLVFGGTMYTDFNLYGNYELHSQCGESGLNDFRYVYTYDEDIRPVTSNDYRAWFRVFISRLQERINATAMDGFDIIVVTHFAPSKKSVSKKYMGKYDHLNPSYASNLENFILENPRIKLWVHGHMHDFFDYKIGQCRVVCAPYGYNHENNYDYKNYNGKVIRLT